MSYTVVHICHSLELFVKFGVADADVFTQVPDHGTEWYYGLETLEFVPLVSLHGHQQLFAHQRPDIPRYVIAPSLKYTNIQLTTSFAPLQLYHSVQKGIYDPQLKFYNFHEMIRPGLGDIRRSSASPRPSCDGTSLASVWPSPRQTTGPSCPYPSDRTPPDATMKGFLFVKSR